MWFLVMFNFLVFSVLYMHYFAIFVWLPYPLLRVISGIGTNQLFIRVKKIALICSALLAAKKCFFT